MPSRRTIMCLDRRLFDFARSWKLGGTGFLTMLALAGTDLGSRPLLAQTGDGGTRERPDLATRPELAATYLLDAIRQGLQTGHLERFGDYLATDFSDRMPDGTSVGREGVIVKLQVALQVASSRTGPLQLEGLSGLSDFQWVNIETKVVPGIGAEISAQADASGGTAVLTGTPRVTFFLEKRATGWLVASSRGLASLAEAIQSAFR